MKKMLLLVAFIVLGTTTLTAQDRDQDRIQDQDQTKLVMINGEMLEVTERLQYRLQEKQKLSDGTSINSNGIYETPDMKQLQLREGECLDNDGILYRNEYQYRYKIQQENKGLTMPQIQERNQNRVHYIMVDNALAKVRTQAQNRLEQQLVLESGLEVQPTGAYRLNDGKQKMLKNGECLNMNGQKFKSLHMQQKMIRQRIIKNKPIPSKPIYKKKGIH